MRLLPALLMTVVTLFVHPAIAQEALSAQKRADIERLLEVTDAIAVSQQMAGFVSANMAKTLRQLRPDIPKEIIDMLPAEVDAVFADNLDSFKELMIPLYHRHFTGEEIKDMIRFYDTDLGKKMVRVMPALARDSMEVGQRWGQSLGPKIDARIRAKLRKEGVAI